MFTFFEIFFALKMQQHLQYKQRCLYGLSIEEGTCVPQPHRLDNLYPSSDVKAFREHENARATAMQDEGVALFHYPFEFISKRLWVESFATNAM
jgi:hypothetical protein